MSAGVARPLRYPHVSRARSRVRVANQLDEVRRDRREFGHACPLGRHVDVIRRVQALTNPNVVTFVLQGDNEADNAADPAADPAARVLARGMALGQCP